MAITAQRRGMVMYASVHALALFVSICSFVLLAPSPVPAATSTTYDYDANGNMIRGDGKYYEYNDANQLARVRKGDASGQILAEYFYDSSGQRVKKIEAGVTTYYIGKHYESVAVGADVPESTANYSDGAQRVASKRSDGIVSWYGLDHLGSTTLLTSGSGSVSERISYYPFGQLRGQIAARYTYTGKEQDSSTGQFYFEARYYDQNTSHFLQADTVVASIYEPGALNRYSYVQNNPLRYTDPTGHKVIIAGTEKEREKLERIKEELLETPSGRRLWESLERKFEKKDIWIYFDPELKALGEYSPITRSIRLNAKYNIEDYLKDDQSHDILLWATRALGHEVYHAVNYRYLDNVTGKSEEDAYGAHAEILRELGGADAFKSEASKAQAQSEIDADPREAAKASSLGVKIKMDIQALVDYIK